MALVLCAHKPASRCPVTAVTASTSSAPTGPLRVGVGCLAGHRAGHTSLIAAADDRRRAGLIEVFSNDPSFEIVGQASTRGEALEQAPPGHARCPLGYREASGRCESTVGGVEARTGRPGPQPGPRQAQGQETGAVNGRAWSMSTRRATTTSSELRLPTSTTTRPALDRLPTILRLGATGTVCGGPATSAVLTLGEGVTCSSVRSAALPQRARQDVSTGVGARRDPVDYRAP